MSLGARMRDAADTLEELNARYDFGNLMPWTAGSLRDEALVVAAEDSEAAR